MIFQQLETFSSVAYGVAATVVAIAVISRLSSSHKLDAIPTVGARSWPNSWLDGFKRLANAEDVIQEGYTKHPSAAFKYVEQLYWMVVVSSREQIEELRSAPEEVFSLSAATEERFNIRHTLGSDVEESFRHVPLVRTHLNRNLGALFSEMRDEIVTAFDDILDLKGNEWKSVLALDTSRQLVCRATNRLFVGLPLCRDPDWVDLNIQYTLDAFTAGVFIGLFPTFLKPLATYILAGAARRGRARALKHLGPIIKERLRNIDMYGKDWDGKPNDLISWFMEETKRPQLTTKSLANCVLSANIAGIHTSSNSFHNALCYLAANPQYIQPLREEIESIVKTEGWSKESVGKMHKVDSVLKECLRFQGVNALTVMRRALKNYTFSDGTFIPKGTMISAATHAVHRDNKYYENANEIDPFRFADMRGTHKDIQCQWVSTGTEYLPFGHGKHACPGRFLAASELKTALAHVIVTYDIKLDGDGPYLQNPNARVLFRKRIN